VMFTPMAVSMIFGLLVSTILTLGLVPLLYALLYRLDFSGLDAAEIIGSAGRAMGGDGTANGLPARATTPATESSR